MPIYEYQCATCGKVTDLKHAFREEPPTNTCPACGASPLKRLYRAAGIVFKGSGFYVNDSRSSKTQATSPASEAPASGEVKSTAPAAGAATTTSPATTTTPTPPKTDTAA